MRGFLHTLLAPRRTAVILGVIAACVLVGLFGAWLFGPALAPLERRLLAILAIVLLWLGVEAVLFWFKRRANTRLLNGLQQVGKEASKAAGEPDELNDQLVEAFDILRSERIGRGLASDFAYALPWYLLIGPPASGKSALVTHSHLRMPVEQQVGRGGIPMQGHATRWWFTDEALLISAPILASAVAPGAAVPGAGQGADGAPGPAAPARDPWQGVLSFLTRYRPRRPLDGVLVAIPADELLNGLGPQRAAMIRARLLETMRVLSVRLQVYVIVTQCDRLIGFEEFFAGLDGETRKRAMGAALPARPGRNSAGGGAPEPQLRRMLDAGLAVVSRLLPFQTATERDVMRRARMMELPEQFALLADAATQFAGALASAGRFDRHMLLRGVFFTAVADAANAPTPLVDGWDARFARPVGLRVATGPSRLDVQTGLSRLDVQTALSRLDVQTALSRQEGAHGTERHDHAHGAAHPAGAHGGAHDAHDRCYFVQGLFQDVIFPQAGLADRNPRAERRTAAIYLGAYALCLLGLLATGSLWLKDYASRQGLLEQFRTNLASQKTLVVNADPSAGLDAVMPLLDQARALADLAAKRTSLARQVGLRVLNINAARSAAIQNYHALLLSRLLPVLQRDLTQEINQALSTGAGVDTLRPLLSVYLMLGEPQHYAASTVSDWASQLISASYALQPQRRAAALAHLQTLLTLLPAPMTLDQNLVAQARGQLRQNPDADLIYARLKQESLHSTAARPLDVVGSLGNAGAQLLMLRSQAGLPVVVPALYTRDGFYQIFLKRAPELVANAGASDWVMGGSGAADPGVSKAVLQEVTDRYVQDYIKQWQVVLSQMSLHALPDMASLVSGLQTLSGPDSPLIQFIQLVKAQTDLGLPPTPPSLVGQVTATATKAAGKAGGAAAGAAAGQAAQSAAAQVIAPAANPLGLANWPGDTIRAPFTPLQALVNAPTAGGQAPVLQVQDTLVAAYGVVSGIASAQSPGVAAQQAAAKVISGQGGDPLIGLRVQAATLPKPIDGIFRALYQNIWSTLLQMTREQIQANWARDVAPACEAQISRRYPFVQSGNQSTSVDVALQDFSNFFGRNGVMDSFVNTNLVPFTTPGANGVLTQSSQSGLSLGLSAQSLDQINRARRFRDLFFDTSGNLQLQFSLVPVYLDPRAVSAVLSIDQTKLNYRHQPPQSVQFKWPPVNAAGSASLVITTVDGQTHEVEDNGPWSVFRLLGAAQRSTPGGSNQLLYTFTLDGLRASFGLRANSVVNPFSSDDFMEFRCVPRL